jgi:tetratricopeptide (TPR) repeat protein
MVKFLCFLVLVTPGTDAQTQAPKPPVSSPTAEAQNLLDTGRLDEALKILDALALQQPEPPGVERLRDMAFYEHLPPAHLLLGQIWLAQSKLTEAVAEFTRESKLNPVYGEVYDRLGDTYLRQDDYSKAQKALDRAVLLEPNSSCRLSCWVMAEQIQADAQPKLETVK